MNKRMSKIYQLEHLVNNGGSQEEIDKLRAELGITDPKKEEKNKAPKEKTDSKETLTVEIYHDLKAKGKSDALIMSDFNMHSPKFYEWKKKNGLIVARKKQNGSNSTNAMVENYNPKMDEEIKLIVLSDKSERPESSHYHTGKIDVWSFADENFVEDEVIGFHRINAIKYIARYGKKNGKNISDLKKAIVSLEKLIEMEEAK